MVETQVSTYLLEFLKIPKYSPDRADHRRVAAAFAKLRLNAPAGGSVKLQAQLDVAVGKMFKAPLALLSKVQGITRAAA